MEEQASRGDVLRMMNCGHAAGAQKWRMRYAYPPYME
jgi:hypothetical protein